METNRLIDQERYMLAAKRVKQLRGFYSHLMVFIIVNLIIVFFNIKNLNEGESYFQWHNFITLMFWGIGLLAHAASVFLPNIIFGKGWEARKIKEFIEKEEQHWE
jgi:hypothetical protein